MSADLLRRAAALIREENEPDHGPVTCTCANPDTWFDRTICPPPCDTMHDRCNDCGRTVDYCTFAAECRSEGNRRAAAWLAVADLLDQEAGRYVLALDGETEQYMALTFGPAHHLANTYLGVTP